MWPPHIACICIFTLDNEAHCFVSSYQLKEKKKQVFLKTTTEGKLRHKQKRAEEEALKEKQEEQRRA